MSCSDKQESREMRRTAMAAITKVADLREQDRRSMEGWLEDHARNWNDGTLDNALAELRSMPECAWRFVATAQLVKLDLKRHWQSGRQVSLKNYLDAYPELGGKGGVSTDLIVAEIKAKSKAGVAVNIDGYIRDYPNQAAELRAFLAEASSAAAGSTRKMRTQTPSGPRPISQPGPDMAPGPPTPASATPRTARSVATPRPSALSPPAPPPAQAAPQAVLPEMFGRYRIEKQLGQGGMGSVYKAYDTELHRHVALKVPQFGPEEGAEVLERFKQEARAAATLRHTNLCQVYDVGAIDGVNFLTMEFIEGQSLEGYAAKQPQGVVSPRFVALIMTRLARALKTAHAKNVIHRDLKPSNIMLRDADGTVEPVIVDFGLARRIEPGSARLTQTGLVIGTWQYMTPEQLCGEPDALGPGCDIYALGVIMYELLTGQLPFDAPGQVVRGNPAAPSSLRAELDPRLESICLKAMASTSAARYASMGDLATALTDYLRGATDKTPEIKAAIAPSGPTSKQVRPQEPATAAPEQPARMPVGKMIAGGLAAGIAFLGVAVGMRSWLGAGSGNTGSGPPAPEAPAVSKPVGAANLPTPSGRSPEHLLDDSGRAIREWKFAAAKTTLSSYLASPAAAKKDDARAILAELDRALTKDEARRRAKGLGDDELKRYLESGVSDLLGEIRNPDLKEACSGILLEAFRQEKAARDAASRVENNVVNTRAPGAMKKAFRPTPPRTPGPTAIPVREIEPGFKPMFNPQNFDGWIGEMGRVIPTKKGFPKTMRYGDCPPHFVAGRDAKTVVSKPVIGILKTDKLYPLNSVKFDYMLTGPEGRPLTKSRALTHAVAEFSLDKPLNVGNMIGCNVVAVSLTASEAGEVTTRKLANRETATQSATGRAAYPNGQWNEMEIKCGERSITVLLNGVEVNRLETPRRFNARIAFSFAGVELHLANVWLR
jgi:serine/threonine protein kinase